MDSKVEILLRKGYNKRTAYRLAKKPDIDIKELPDKGEDNIYKFSKGEFV